jgi:endonuclease/exonuclease/phosphatase family metal-dependent hydrolase
MPRRHLSRSGVPTVFAFCILHFELSHLRLTALSILIAAAGCAPIAPATAPTGTPVLTVVTWNMHGGDGDLPRLLDDLAGGRLAPAGDFIVLLQEAADEGDRAVGKLAAGRGLSVTFHLTPERSIGNAIVSTLSLDAPRVIELPRERQPRRALMAGVQVAGLPMFVVSAHLENRLGWLRGLFGDRARGRQAAALLDEIPRGHGILGGDMNTMLGPDEPALRAFLMRFPDTPERPEPTFRDRLVLDHLFFDLPDGWIVSRRVLADRYGSDHHPVVGSISRR